MFRNREIKQFSFIYLIIALVSNTMGFMMTPKTGLLTLSSSVAFGVAFYVFTRERYVHLAKMADQIDQVLHHADCLFIGESVEGELSILESEISKMTVRIREQNEALKREKENLSDTLADIAHQLRTPLTSATLILTLLDKEDKADVKKKMLREAEALFTQMEWLLNSLLKLSRLDSDIIVFKKETVNVKALIMASLRPFNITMELHEIDLKLNITENLTIVADFDWLSEAIQNIIKNCIESIKDKGMIEITCNSNPLYTEILVQDNGPGFRKKDLYNLFNRFYRGKHMSINGYGIGMALTKKIITGQGGMISAKNRINGGACFSICFSK